jgi:hypothetical protein
METPNIRDSLWHKGWEPGAYQGTFLTDIPRRRLKVCDQQLITN